jgi:ubiquinone/menaquinone biosynthesis C-methylase UbiE
MSDEIQYPDHFITRLHTVWGEGFLSPGGPEEVGEIIRGIDLSGKVVLDIGFGTGGPAVTLAKDHQAGKVIGIDVEAQLRNHANQLVERTGLADRIELKIVKPGPFSFAAETFDVVFSKDSMIHIEDKDALFEEVMRVLKPGGFFVASDWLSGEGDDAKIALDKYRKVSHLHFTPATATEMAGVLAKAGFLDIETRDRNEWYATVCAYECEQVEGPLKQQLIDAVGEEIYTNWLGVRRGLLQAVSGGGLRPTHLRGVKPAN